MMRLLLLSLIGVLHCAAIADADAATYRAASAGVEVKVRGGTVLVVYADPACGLRSGRAMRIRDGRFRGRQTVTCEVRLGEERTSEVIVAGRIAHATVRGHVDGRRFVAERGGARLTAGELCGLRGATRAETPLVRVFAEGLRTIACRRSDGLRSAIARTLYDEGRYYATGVDARFVRATGSVIAYTSAPIDTAQSKYAQDPGYETDVVVRDLADGRAVRTRARVFTVTGFAMRADGAVAWAGPPGSLSYRDIVVQTAEDGEAVTLDRGPIDPASLRVAGGRFVWDRTSDRSVAAHSDRVVEGPMRRNPARRLGRLTEHTCAGESSFACGR